MTPNDLHELRGLLKRNLYVLQARYDFRKAEGFIALIDAELAKPVDVCMWHYEAGDSWESECGASCGPNEFHPMHCPQCDYRSPCENCGKRTEVRS